MVRTYFNSGNSPGYIQVNKVSQVVPDATLTVRMILHRFTKGLPFTDTRTPVYYNDDDFDNPVPDLDSMDLSEQHDLMQWNKERISKIKNSLQDEKRKKAKKDAAIEPAGDPGQQPSESPADSVGE